MWCLLSGHERLTHPVWGFPVPRWRVLSLRDAISKLSWSAWLPGMGKVVASFWDTPKVGFRKDTGTPLSFGRSLILTTQTVECYTAQAMSVARTPARCFGVGFWLNLINSGRSTLQLCFSSVKQTGCCRLPGGERFVWLHVSFLYISRTGNASTCLRGDL